VENFVARLYVKSVKTITGTKEFEQRTFVGKIGSRPERIEIEGKRMKGTFVLKMSETEMEPRYEFILPENQQRIVEMVKEIASRNNLKVEIVDVTKENVLHRAIQGEIEKIRTFPTLIVSSAERIEGNITEKQIKRLFRKEKSL